MLREKYGVDENDQQVQKASTVGNVSNLNYIADDLPLISVSFASRVGTIVMEESLGGWLSGINIGANSEKEKVERIEDRVAELFARVLKEGVVGVLGEQGGNKEKVVNETLASVGATTASATTPITNNKNSTFM
tara:strand:+ start:160 stop:561 length:402 start_codon:yes stop_codon:yes gene_type:complete